MDLSGAPRRSRLDSAAKPLVCLVAALAGLYLALVASPVEAGSRSRVSADAMAFIGHAWLLESGRWSYRDFSAAWGPIPQTISRLGVGLRADGDFVSSGPMIYFLLRAVGVLALAAWVVWLPFARGWPVLIPLAAFAWTQQSSSHVAFRIGFALLALRACAAALSAPGPRIDWRVTIAAAALLTAAGLCSLDVLVYALLALAGGAAALAVLDRYDRRRVAARTGAILGAFAAATAGLVTIAAATSVAVGDGPLAPMRQVAARAATFSQVFGRPLDAEGPAILSWAALILLAIALVLAVGRDRAEPLRVDLVLLLPFALLSLKSAVTRADRGHVAFGLTATLALLSLLPTLRSLGSSARAVRFALLGLALALWPVPTLASGLPLAESGDPMAAWRSLRERRIAAELLPRDLLAAAALHDGPIFAFPLHSGWAAAAGRPLVASVDQAYGAHSPASQEAVVAALRTAGGELEVIYGLDGLSAWRVDGVQSIARSPVLAEYLLRHFVRQPVDVLDGGYLLLRPRAAPRRLEWERIEARLRGGKEGVALEWQPGTRCPLYRLELELRYPARHRFGWAGGIRVRGESSGETRIRTRLVALEIDRSFSTWFSPLGGRAFATLFDDVPPPQAPVLDRLVFEPEATGPFGVAPGEIRPVTLECLVTDGAWR